MADKSTSTSDPVTEDDHMQVVEYTLPLFLASFQCDSTGDSSDYGGTDSPKL